MRLTIAILAAAIVLLLAVPARAETLPATPQAKACTATPVTISDLQALVAAGTPIAATPAPAANLDDATKAAIVTAIEGSIACTNANQPLRALAFITDGYLVHRFTGAGHDDLGHLAAAVTRSPSPAAGGDRLALISVGDFALLPDGRISAVVTTANADQTFVDTLIFANVDGKWLIDEIASETPAPATPVA
jgi:hypothetical protein